MKRHSIGFLGAMALGVTSLLAAEVGMDLESLKVSGTYLGGGSMFRQNDLQRTQFDYAANLDFEYEISDELTGIVQLQMGAGNGTLGFVGPGVVVTDLNLVYTNQEHDVVATFGSYDAPFGNGVAYLTNNGDSFPNDFINNSLMYSALAGPVGTLNTLGLMIQKPLPYVTLTGSFTNGTDETANQGGHSFMTILSASTEVVPGAVFSASVMESDDQEDPTVANANSTQAEVSGYVIDGEYSIFGATLRGYFGKLSYGDDLLTTNDNVDFMMAQLKYQVNDALYGAVRYSNWLPEGAVSDRSALLPAPSYTVFGTNPDSEVRRAQIVVGYQLEDNLMIKAEALQDDYETGEDVVAGLLYFNGRF